MNRRLPRLALMLLLALCFIGNVRSATAQPPLEHRWLYLQTNLQVEENVGKTEALLKRAAAVGYNGVVLADYKLNVLDRVPHHYFPNLARFKKAADAVGIEVIPAIASFGYSEGILSHNPNLADGIPARNVPLVVKGSKATVDGPENLLNGGGFEELKGASFTGWDFQDEPGKTSVADTEVKHGGKSALRFDDPGRTNSGSGNARVTKRIKVHPWGQYHGSVWIKTSDFATAHDVKMIAIGKDGRTLAHSNLDVKPTQDWTLHHVVFNSLNNDEVVFYIGAWSAKTGKLWVDDARLEETAFLNMVRRESCPLEIKTASGKVLVEGRDFKPLVDAKMGNTPWPGGFDVYHQPPVVELLPVAKLKDGDRLLASYYHAVTIYDNQVACALGSPEVLKIVRDQVEQVEKLLHPQRFMLSYDEIRVAGWSDNPHNKPAGEVLADNVRAVSKMVRDVNPKAELCFWSDMFDPAHNAVDNYYLVQGSLAGSWQGLPPHSTIINWNSEKPGKSLKWFADQGHTQVLAGYYDGPPDSIVAWLKAGKGIKGIDGAMYTTWRGDFSQLERFAELAWGGKAPKQE